MLHISYLHIARLQQTFWTNVSLNFRSFLFRIPFHWKWVHFRSGFCRTLPTLFLLMDSGIPAFILFFFTKTFPISSWKHLVYCKIFLFCQKTVLVVFPDYSFITTKSPILFFICPQMVAFEYFQYDLIFDISE